MIVDFITFPGPAALPDHVQGRLRLVLSLNHDMGLGDLNQIPFLQSLAYDSGLEVGELLEVGEVTFHFGKYDGTEWGC